MSIVFGEQVLISFLKLGDYLPYGCARSTTLNLTGDIIAKSTVGSGNWKEKEVVALDWNFTIEGVMSLGASGYFLPNDIYNQWFSMQPVQLEFIVNDDDGNSVVMGGTALITNVSTNGAVNNSASFNITGEGTGGLWTSTSFQITKVEPNTPAAGQTRLTFDFDLLTNANAYTIQINDLTASTTIDDTAAGPPRTEIVDATHDYSFSYRAEYSGGPGDWLGKIYYYSTAGVNYLSDGSGGLIINSNSDNILTS
jgi:predicted secreted protein